jgi:uncharacterized protein (UPF0548 family)
LVPPRLPPDAAAVARWRSRQPGSTRAGPRPALHDRYSLRIQPRTGETERNLFDVIRHRLFRYDIFPPSVMFAAMAPAAPLSEGATIVQRVQFGMCAVEAGVRVVEVWGADEGVGQDAGFAYVTLMGHPECGVESFRVTLGREGVTLTIEAWSRPGDVLTWVAFPLARAVQIGLTRAALRRFRR